MNIELTKDQAQNLLQLIDVAVKAAGLQAAKPAYDVASIIQEAINQEEKQVTAQEDLTS